MKKRIIPLNYQNVTGYKSLDKSKPQLVESTLEFDFLTILNFDCNVESIETQPITIEYISPTNKRTTYTPDVLVRYKDGSQTIFEVKHREDLFLNWKKLKPKFKAAIKYCTTNKMSFKIITENEIRTDYLTNIKFLNTYLTPRNIEIPRAKLVEQFIKSKHKTTPNEILNEMAKTDQVKAEILYILWSEIAVSAFLGFGGIKTNLFNPLTMNSETWYEE